VSGLVDWDLAARGARLLAGGDDERPEPEALRRAVAESEGAVERYTGLEPARPVPEAEWVSRREWATVNLASMRAAIGPLEERIASEDGIPGGPDGPLATVLGKLAALQLAALVGFASRRVLGQYELPLLGPERPARLLFVAPNVSEARASLRGDERAVLRWIALHEVTHAVQFGSAPWLRDHLGGLLRELLEGSQLALGPTELRAAARHVVSTDPRKVLAELRESDPLTLLTPPDSRGLLETTQATMAAVEGYAEHVMDAAAPELGEDVGTLRAAMERRREERPPLARLLSWLLGLELKLRQYRDGKRFCDAVVERAGVATLNRAWTDPEALPVLAELADPEAWLARVAPSAAHPEPR
jgi:coenzyme F420 biosynthesis associated uncharacterized protein